MKSKKSGELVINSKDKGDASLKPLYVVDGKIVDDPLPGLKPDDIATINVLKGKAAKDKYGDDGENGVIEITMKKK